MNFNKFSNKFTKAAGLKKPLPLWAVLLYLGLLAGIAIYTRFVLGCSRFSYICEYPEAYDKALLLGGFVFLIMLAHVAWLNRNK